MKKTNSGMKREKLKLSQFNSVMIKPDNSFPAYDPNKTQGITYNKERLAKLALPRGITQN